MEWIRKRLVNNVYGQSNIKKPKANLNYKKITWQQLKQKLNQEIKEHKSDNTEYSKNVINYLTYLKGELEVELFIKNDK